METESRVPECLVCEGWGAYCDKHRAAQPAPALDVERLAEVLEGFRLNRSPYYAPNLTDGPEPRLMTPQEWAADILARLSSPSRSGEPNPDMDEKCAKCGHRYGTHSPRGCANPGPSCPCTGFLHRYSFPVGSGEPE